MTENVNIDRGPKKYPRRSLHGRPRLFTFPYSDADRVATFYTKVFGWDIYDLPIDMDAGRTMMYAATGPGTHFWEPIVPGYVFVHFSHAAMVPAQGPSVTLECDNIGGTLRRVEAKGGKILSGRIGEDDWSNSAVFEDTEGNVIGLWEAPDSRTWEEPEAQWDKD